MESPESAEPSHAWTHIWEWIWDPPTEFDVNDIINTLTIYSPWNEGIGPPAVGFYAVEPLLQASPLFR